MLLRNHSMQKLKLLEHNLEGLEIYNSSFLDLLIFLPNLKIPQLYDLIPVFIKK
jgi:hypothetical protein